MLSFGKCQEKKKKKRTIPSLNNYNLFRDIVTYTFDYEKKANVN